MVNKLPPPPLTSFNVRGTTMRLPVFFPDATRGVIRSLESEDIKQSGIEGVIVNTYHLMSEPGTTVIQKAGGVKKFMGFDGWVISDSGGFQVLSLIYKDPSFGKIDDDGVTFLKGSKGKKEKYVFTPEKSIQVQFALDADILICLDDCPPRDAPRKKVEECVHRTLEWAKRSKMEFEKQISQRREKERSYKRPLLFAVIQGNNDRDLRKRCAEGLINIGFDGYGFGGWPLTQENTFNENILRYTASLMPDHLPKYALGVGMPKDIIRCVQMGYTIFDTVLPTRDARHRRLYVFRKNPATIDFTKESDCCDYIHIKKEQYACDTRPLSPFCDCLTCRRHSRAYLHHLFRIEDAAAHRLATIHNMRTYSLLIAHLRNQNTPKSV